MLDNRTTEAIHPHSRRAFLGGGFGSYEFYAFDLKTGQQAWQIQTGDDGPTAATPSPAVLDATPVQSAPAVAEAPATAPTRVEVPVAIPAPAPAAAPAAPAAPAPAQATTGGS